MADAGLEFRATKDLDIVLVVEALDAEFGREIWRIVEAGGYAIRQRSDGTPRLYRFQNPEDERFPRMIELFSRQPDALIVSGSDARLTPLPIAETVSSLSAILLDDAYYRFIVDGRRHDDGLVWVGPDRLIPLKASAWLDLQARREAGADIDSRDIRKYANDVLRLAQLLSATDRIDLPATVSEELDRFLEQIGTLAIDVKGLGLVRTSLSEVVARIRTTYGRPSPRGDRQHG